MLERENGAENGDWGVFGWTVSTAAKKPKNSAAENIL